MNATKIPTITVKNLKTFDSPDGGGFNATVYLDGKRFCLAHDGGYGGCIDFDILKAGDHRKDVFAKISEIEEAIKGDPDYIEHYSGKDMQKDFEWLVNDAVNEVLKNKAVKQELASFKRKSKGRIIFRKPDDDPQTFWKTKKWNPNTYTGFEKQIWDLANERKAKGQTILAVNGQLTTEGEAFIKEVA